MIKEELFFILEFVLNASKGLALFFVIGISLASLIKTLRLDLYLNKAFEGKKAAAIPIATATGAFSPLCSCGVIPAIAALLASGVPLSPIMAFWITSPLMDPESFVLTYGVFGKEMAIARLTATISIGLIAGYITLYLSTKGILDNQILKEFGKDRQQVAAVRETEEINLDKRQIIIVRFFQFLLNFKDMTFFVGKYILVAFILEAIIIRYVPMDWIGGLLGGNNPFGPITAAIIGVPAYSNSISSIPIIRGLMDLGMDKGTALSFMIGGAATSIPAMVAVFSIVKKKIFLLYITFSMVGAIVAGYIYRLF
ncbi:permease [Alkaliphilus peptidifermentans]|uniref:Permease n=1 Tax=Alkaliphilus peptidifermentans DSM 18978 TaxID=1120976 RepID=A0A1G5K9V1_9FIRM|nr:permease [Alkaliphilus peptidifermentans]SCY97214.1 hypothetical protein SAMN03080606_03336 [Alkaliphilus peptidifermentans DSM 18978]